MKNVFGTNGKQRYLFVPAAPTPNGPLHLGHIAGSYLKMDVLARHRKSRGNHVSMIFGTDPYESYVEAAAHIAGISCEALATHFYNDIRRDLNTMNIGYDLFINPVSEEWQNRYISKAHEVLNELAKIGATYVVREKVPFSKHSNRCLIGCWLFGICPSCGAGMRGFFCEDCGGQFSPSEVNDPRGSLINENIFWQEESSLFVSVRDAKHISEWLDCANVPTNYRDIVNRHVDRQGLRIRLSHPGTWGIPFGKNNHVLFSYSALYSYALLCGEIWGEMNASDNAFAPESNVTVVRSFGIDASIPILVGLNGLADVHRKFRRFDNLIGNHFYLLDGLKFSTSRRHAVFVDDAMRHTSMPVDGIRHYLALTSPESRPTSMSLSDLRKRVIDDVFQCIYTSVAAVFDTLVIPATRPSSHFVNLFKNFIEKQDASLQLDLLSLNQAAAVPIEWARRFNDFAESGCDQYWWLKALSLLLEPTMPDVALSIWNRLGHFGRPAIGSFFDIPDSAPVSEPFSLPQMFLGKQP